VPPTVWLPCEEPVVGWLTGVLLAGWRASEGDGTLRGAGEDWFRREGVETLPCGLLVAEEGVGVAMAAQIWNLTLAADQARITRNLCLWTYALQQPPVVE
jgi:hypothetical protein